MKVNRCQVFQQMRHGWIVWVWWPLFLWQRRVSAGWVCHGYGPPVMPWLDVVFFWFGRASFQRFSGSGQSPVHWVFLQSWRCWPLPFEPFLSSQKPHADGLLLSVPRFLSQATKGLALLVICPFLAPEIVLNAILLCLCCVVNSFMLCVVV